MDHTAEFYMRPSYEFHGSGFPVFHGARRQRGGGIFGSLGKMFAPIAKKVGKKLLSHGVGLAKDIASDVLAGKNIKDSFISRGKATASNLGRSMLNDGLSGLSQMIGQGKGRRRLRAKRRRHSSRKRQVKRLARSRSRTKTSRKRKRPAKSSSKRPAKRRRVSFNF